MASRSRNNLLKKPFVFANGCVYSALICRKGQSYEASVMLLKPSRRQCLSTLAGTAGYVAFPLSSKAATAATIPVHSVIVNFQYEISACCSYYYQVVGNHPAYPVNLEGRCMELFVTAPGEAERSLATITGGEILADAHNPSWGGTYPRASNPFPAGAKGIYVVRLQALTYKSTDRIGGCRPPNPTYPSIQIDASYTVLLNGEQTPSLPAPNGSFRWSGQNHEPKIEQMIWIFDVS
jgi:hypothetical protein